MFFVYLGIYVIISAFIWGFFIVAKLHSYKFKSFSTHIEPVTMLLFTFLAVLTILGFILLFFLDTPFQPSANVNTANPTQENYY